jgi:SAM-dependent methyltransferase
MEVVNLRDKLMEQTLVYRLWMAPFADRKFAPVERHTSLRPGLRVLDVGCGPGTNAGYFGSCHYIGVDINARYVESARRRHKGTFLVGDATKIGSLIESRFDLILVNSFLHHVPEEDAVRILATLDGLLADEGEIDVIELVLPRQRGIARALARADRGDFPRPAEAWRRMFERIFDPIVVEPFRLGTFGITLWEMVYLKGKRRRDGAALGRMEASRPPSNSREQELLD